MVGRTRRKMTMTKIPVAKVKDNFSNILRRAGKEEKDLRSSQGTFTGWPFKETAGILRPPIRMADSE
jgi:hypothetical protein